jgi:hypothetical protein
MTDPAGVWLDDLDQTILDQLAALQTRLDPPLGRPGRADRFAIALDGIDIGVARLSDDLLVGSGACWRTATTN